MSKNDRDEGAHHHMNWWLAIFVALGLLIIHRVVLLAIHFARSAFSHEISIAETLSDPFILGLSQALAAGIMIWIVWRYIWESKNPDSAIGSLQVPSIAIACAFVSGVALQFPLAEISNWTLEIWPISIEEQLRRLRIINPEHPASQFAAILAFVAIAPVSEELIFRGFILRGLRDRYGKVFAIGMSSLLFGAVHQEPNAIIYASLGGIVLASIAIATNSTLPGIFLHAGINATPILLSQKIIAIPGFNSISEEPLHIAAWLVSLTTALALAGSYCVLWLCRRTQRA